MDNSVETARGNSGGKMKEGMEGISGDGSDLEH